MRTMEAENVIEMLHITKEIPSIIANERYHTQLRRGKSRPPGRQRRQIHPDRRAVRSVSAGGEAKSRKTVRW